MQDFIHMYKYICFWKAWNGWFWLKKKIGCKVLSIGKNTLAKTLQNIFAYSFVSEYSNIFFWGKKLVISVVGRGVVAPPPKRPRPLWMQVFWTCSLSENESIIHVSSSSMMFWSDKRNLFFPLINLVNKKIKSSFLNGIKRGGGQRATNNFFWTFLVICWKSSYCH